MLPPDFFGDDQLPWMSPVQRERARGGCGDCELWRALPGLGGETTYHPADGVCECPDLHRAQLA